MIIHPAATRRLPVLASAASLLLLGRPSIVVLVAAERNPKKGVSFRTTQSCSVLEGHTTSSWWYSWGASSTGFEDSFCPDGGASAVSAARASGMEFVPMFWNSVPSFPFSDANLDANMQEATYLMTFNEPEKTDQANIPAADAAAMWTDIVTIADHYGLEIVGPCMTNGGPGRTWYNQFVAECDSLYGPGTGCRTEYTCIHQYFQPYPCDPGVESWACIGNSAASSAVSDLNYWYSTYGNKPIWVTEYACAPWGGADCDEAKHTAAMEQLTAVYESSGQVFRYAWYTTYDGSWIGNALNELIWTSESGLGCPGYRWIAGFGDAGWQIQTTQECLAAADNDLECHTPLVLSIDDDSCYCSVDACQTTTPTWGAMTTLWEVGARDSADLTALGDLYNAFGVVSGTSAPSHSPTSGPTSTPTEAPSHSPTSGPTSTPTEAPAPSPTPPTNNEPDGVCSKYSTSGWHSGDYLKVLEPTDAPDGSSWTWEECAAECNLSTNMPSPCEFWTLQVAGARRCLLMGNQGLYNESGDQHYEGDRDPDCLPAATTTTTTTSTTTTTGSSVVCANLSREPCKAESACKWQGVCNNA